MTHDEHDAFVGDIVRAVVRTDGVVFSRTDSHGAVEYMIFPRRRITLEQATEPRYALRRKRRRAPVS